MPRYLLHGTVVALGRPGHDLPRPERPVDPDYGIEEGELPEIGPPEVGGGPVLPEGIWPPNIELPPGVWPPPGKPGLPIELPPGVDLPPGTVWPPLEPPEVGGGPAPQPPRPGIPAFPTPPIAHPPKKAYCAAIVGVTGTGKRKWAYVVVDFSEMNRPGHPLPLPPRPGQPEPR